jgi:hypothetical protein
MNDKYTGKIADYININSPYVMLMYEVEKKYWNSKTNHCFRLPVPSRGLSPDSEASIRSLEGVTAYPLASQNARRPPESGAPPPLHSRASGHTQPARNAGVHAKPAEKRDAGGSNIRVIFNHSFQNGSARLTKPGHQTKTDSFAETYLKGRSEQISISPSAKLAETSVRSSTNQQGSTSKMKRGTETSSWRIAKVDMAKATLTNRSKLYPHELKLKSERKYLVGNKRGDISEERSERSTDKNWLGGSRYLATVGPKATPPLMSIRGLTLAAEDHAKAPSALPRPSSRQTPGSLLDTRLNSKALEPSTSRSKLGPTEADRVVRKGALFTDLKQMQEELRARETSRRHGPGMASGGGLTGRPGQLSYLGAGLTPSRLQAGQAGSHSSSHLQLVQKQVRPQILVHVPLPYSSQANLPKKQAAKVDLMYDRPIKSKLFSAIKSKLTLKSIN